MQKGEIKFICFLLFLIILFSGILIYKIETKPQYDAELYAKVYSEYDEIFSDMPTHEAEDTQEHIAETEDTISEPGYIVKGMNSGNYLTERRVIGQIDIPKINITYPVLNETNDEYLKIAPTKMCGSDVNHVGNLCIVGHNYKNNKFFSKLNELQINDKVYLTSDSQNKQEYLVYDKYEVKDNDFSCTSQETNGKIELTLITCTTKKDERLVVKCRAKI